MLHWYKHCFYCPVPRYQSTVEELQQHYHVIITRSYCFNSIHIVHSALVWKKTCFNPGQNFCYTIHFHSLLWNMNHCSSDWLPYPPSDPHIFSQIYLLYGYNVNVIVPKVLLTLLLCSIGFFFFSFSFSFIALGFVSQQYWNKWTELTGNMGLAIKHQKNLSIGSNLYRKHIHTWISKWKN